MSLEWDIPSDVESLIFDAIDTAEVQIPESEHDERHPHVLWRARDVSVTLIACSCVCKMWRKYALEHLFKIVTARSEDNSPLQADLSRLIRSWNLNLKIQTLELQWQASLAPQSFSDLSPELESLPSLIVYYPQLGLLQDLVPNLRYLTLRVFPRLTHRHYFARMLNGVPRLKALHLHGCLNLDRGFFTREEEDAIGIIPILSIKLEEFSIRYFVAEEIDSWLWLLQSSLDSLHTFIIKNAHGVSCSTTAFQCVGQSVRCLGITQGSLWDYALATGFLPLCPNLTHLILDLEWFLSHHAMIAPVIPASLTSLRLHSTCEEEDSPYRRLTNALLTCRLASHLTQLEELVLDVYDSTEGNFEGFKYMKDKLEKPNGIHCRSVVYPPRN